MKLYITPKQLKEITDNKKDEEMIAIEVSIYKKCTNCNSDYLGNNQRICAQCEDMFKVTY